MEMGTTYSVNKHRFVSVLQEEILHKLYCYRYCSSEDLVYLIFPDFYRESVRMDTDFKKLFNKKRSRILKELEKLVEQRFVKRKPFMKINDKAYFYFKINSRRQIEVLYNLEKPILQDEECWGDEINRMQEILSSYYTFPETIFLTEGLNSFVHELNKIEIKLDGKFKFAYLNRPYVDKIFEVEGKKVTLKPDAEFKVISSDIRIQSGISSWVEINTTDHNFSRKLHAYRKYLDAGQSFPSHLLVYETECNGTPLKLLNRFLEDMPGHAAKTNLIFANRWNLAQTINSQLNEHQLFMQLKDYIIRVAQKEVALTFADEQLVSMAKDMLGWDPYFTTMKDSDNRINLYLYVKYDCKESQGFAKILDFNHQRKALNSLGLEFDDIIPVFYYLKGKPKGIPRIPILKNSSLNFMEAIWFAVEDGLWFDNHRIELKGAHAAFS